MSQETWQRGVRILATFYLVLSVFCLGLIIVQGVPMLVSFRLELLYFIVSCFANYALLHGAKAKKVPYLITWLFFGIMQAIALFWMGCSQLPVPKSDKHPRQTFGMSFLLMFGGLAQVCSWIVVFRFFQKVMTEVGEVRVQNQSEGSHGIQIRYGRNGEVEFLGGTGELAPGVYTISPGNKRHNSSSSAAEGNDFGHEYS